LTRDEWIQAYAEKIGVEPPTTEQVNEVLDLAAAAAHGSEKTAAPLACWLAGTSGKALADLRRAAEALE
jgi:hypothetical protein